MAPVAVVGAGMAGLRACEGLRRAGYDGVVTVFGREPHLPYSRPPLSKVALAADAPEPELFRRPPSLDDVVWRTGAEVVAADLAARTVTTADGATTAWSGLVVASGLRPRTLDLPGPAAGRHVLRTIEDAAALRAAIRPGVAVAVVGAGFVGCELALTLAGLGARVHVIEPAEIPMEAALGPLLGTVVQQHLLAAGVTLHLGATPTAYVGDATVEAVGLEDGELVPADLVVEAVGSLPNTAWLAGNGLDITDGLACGPDLRVADRPDVVACGDVARFPHPLRPGPARRTEHWTLAADTGRIAGRVLGRHLAGRPAEREAAPLPSFWSDLGALRVQSFGIPAAGSDDIRVLEGDPSGDIAVGYHRDDALVGVVLLGMGHRYPHYRGQVAAVLAAAERGGEDNGAAGWAGGEAS